MLTLKNITKDYTVGDTTVHALRGVSIEFRESEFVAVLGPSGCGKTTLLNLIGGLDQYTSGDLVINGRSTREYGDKDWDTYRNHSIGFVFQSYNLIPHQSVLANVELALTISGVSREERRERAVKVLERVGLGDQIYKKPNQMSGGQMQRVAIARALINDPDILLADEPTGALDSETSVQVMDILKEIAQEKLVIMVTHTPELAERYATRTVRLLDGRITGDSDPYDGSRAPQHSESGKKKPSMSFLTALSLSLNNLMTKKGRTVLTAFAGSIGIIGIALILSLSNGIQTYIDQVQEDTLSTYPLTIEAEAADLSSMIEAMSGAASESGEHERDAVYSNVIMYDLMDSLMSMDTETNDLASLKEFLDSDGGGIGEFTSAVQYVYDPNFDIYTKDADGNVVKSDVVELLNELMANMYGGDFSSYFDTMGDFYSSFESWQEMLPGENGELINQTLLDQYDVIYGSWPQDYNEVVLIVDQNNEVSDLVLYTLGLRTEDELTSSLEAYMNGETVDAEVESWSYEELCGMSFKLVGYYDRYVYDSATGTYTDVSNTAAGLDYLYENGDVGVELKISGIVRQNEDAVAGMMTGGSIGYTGALVDRVIEQAAGSEVITDQMADPETDVISGLPFSTGEEPEPSAEELRSAVDEYIASLDTAAQAGLYTDIMTTPTDDYLDSAVQQAMSELTREDIEGMMLEGYAEEMGVDAEAVRDYVSQMDDETLMGYVEEMAREAIAEQYAEGVRAQLSAMSQQQLAMALNMAQLSDWQYEYVYDELMPERWSDSSYEENLELLGYVDLNSPDSINLYAASFADKDEIARIIDEYNASVDEEQQISYTDYVAILMSSVSTIINAISYVLIAFVAISLVVSSIMIGIITYISVLERTKEIGILRAIGASKRDVANVFNAETLIEGFSSGLLGIVVTLILIIPINAIVQHLTGIATLRAILPAGGAVALVIISMFLTLIAGLIPSRFAARRDPVEALRTE